MTRGGRVSPSSSRMSPRSTLALAETMEICKLATLGSVGGMTVPFCRTRGRPEDLLCEFTLGERETYDDDMPQEVILDVLLDLAFVRVDLEPSV